VETKIFGQTDSGAQATLFTLRNKNGLIARITNYGAAITEMHVPDRNGESKDVTLGFDSLEGYLRNDPFFGVIAGRYANRIAKGQFSLGAKSYDLAVNNGPNHLHGGKEGFNTKIWSATPLSENDSEGVRLTYTSPNNEEGYPGELKVQLDYILSESNELRMDYQATSDEATPINLTNHAYWNLGGEGSGQIGNHEISINADFFTPVDDDLIPTGEIHSVANTPLDFRSSRLIGERIKEVGHTPTGYDHNFVLKKSEIGALERAATARHEGSGRQMEVLTTEPGIQLYTANFLDGTIVGKSGTPYEYQNGLCLECQHFPDSPNQPHFPATILYPGTVYKQTTVHRFSVRP
jgi:aldose 1-epimerase